MCVKGGLAEGDGIMAKPFYESVVRGLSVLCACAYRGLKTQCLGHSSWLDVGAQFAEQIAYVAV